MFYFDDRQTFPGAPTPKVGAQAYYFEHFFPANCMKLKKNGPRGCTYLAPPLDPPRDVPKFLNILQDCFVQGLYILPNFTLTFKEVTKLRSHFSKFTAH